ncbi:DNA (cytosine-5-)-methyltransferase [Candidatus Parcubacteria bacterium]|nr:DNA (cytosine-5-)-methyltransferase [Candidatus Parcubacteria bacterium]
MKQKINKKYTYISLFSSAGVGCFGFKENDFECIATNEIIDKRLDIQKANNTCKYDSGYIYGDITDFQKQEQLFNEVEKWKKDEKIKDVDVIVATPPCQGMSTANYKKNNEQTRNSLVIEAIKIIKNIEPRIFIFENVRAFLNTICTDIDGCDKTILKSIYNNLSKKYNIYQKVINFKDYGVPSSRPRTIVIGTSKKLLNVSPLNLFPIKQREITLRKAIGYLKTLKYGEQDNDDIYHFAREYPKYMEEWISNVREGQSAFNNKIKPYKLINGEKIPLKSAHLGNKFRRLFWDKSGACIATRNDQLASQDTIHPADNRVLSIRELMVLMSIPDNFKWTNDNINEIFDKKIFLKKNELNIRRCIGEAVPTKIFFSIAKNINELLNFEDFFDNYKKNNLKQYFQNKTLNSNYYIHSFLKEELLTDRKLTGSFYTPQAVVFHAIKNFKPENNQLIRILEPAVGLGAFIPQLLRLIDDVHKVVIDVIDINKETLSTLKHCMSLIQTRDNIEINYIHKDFLKLDIKPNSYDLVVANPPYGKPNTQAIKEYRRIFDSNKPSNLFDFFMRKLFKSSKELILIIPKTFLMAAGYEEIRKLYEKFSIVFIGDFGVKFFKRVFVEIISIHFKKDYKKDIVIESLLKNKKIFQKQKYIFHDKVWLLYRNRWFDQYIKKLLLDCFTFFRDRQITNKYLKNKGKIRVLKSKNITDSGNIVNISGYDSFIDDINDFNVKKHVNSKCVIMPNFTYNTRASKLPNNCVPNGSIAILMPRDSKLKNKIDLQFYSTDAFRRYYAIVKNHSRFTLNIDASSIYYIGIKNN